MSVGEFEEFEELEDFDSLDEAQDVVEDVSDTALQSDESMDEIVEEGASAEISDESSGSEVTADSSTESASRFGWLGKMTVYDAMLLTSLVTISLACLLMLIELCSFSLTPFSQMYTTEAYVEPLRPPN